jgi:hypothetical protein
MGYENFLMSSPSEWKTAVRARRSTCFFNELTLVLAAVILLPKLGRGLGG